MELFEKRKIAQMCRVYRAKSNPPMKQDELAKECGLKQHNISYLEAELWGKVSAMKIEKVKKYLEMMTGIGA